MLAIHLRRCEVVASLSNMSQVIYARVPDNLKEAADSYAHDRGMTLTGAVVDLLERGLAAVSDERSIADLEARFAQVSAEKAQLDANLRVVATEIQALRAFAERATQTQVGTCPNPECGKPITGYALLGTGRCDQCGQTLTDLLAPRSTVSTLDQREFGLLVGALGAALVGAVFLASKQGA